jgi:hypothetical protein
MWLSLSVILTLVIYFWVYDSNKPRSFLYWGTGFIDSIIRYASGLVHHQEWQWQTLLQYSEYVTDSYFNPSLIYSVNDSDKPTSLLFYRITAIIDIVVGKLLCL